MISKFKTKFPMARIKKIMQIDEEIGKVAQTTPVVISKALELFLQEIVEKAASFALAHSGKITPYTIKKVVVETREFDFLNALVKEIPDQVEDFNASKESKRVSPKRKTLASKKEDFESDKESDESDLVLSEDERPMKRRSRQKIKISALISNEDED